MDLFKFIIISLHIAKVFSRSSRKKYTSSSSSDESIENLLYYKDCQHRRNEPVITPKPKPPPEPMRQNSCPNPRMCCSLSCDNDCGGGNMMLKSRQDSMSMGIQPIVPQVQPGQFQMPPQQPMMSRTRGLKRKRILPADMMPPIGTRRDAGFTKEKIKSLISKDGDIRKILKDLVRVTMQKVDLIDALKSRRSGNTNGIVNNNNYQHGNEIGDENDGVDEEQADYHHHSEDDYENDEDDDDLE